MRRFISAFLVLLTVASVCNATARGLPAQEGIENFGKVDAQLFRGAQPGADAIKNLQKLGIKTIICLRPSGKDWQAELSTANALGILCTNFPLSGTRRPTDKQVAEILSAIESLPGPVFVHCKYGCERTGTIVACYRIQHDNWSGSDALEEANRHGMSKWFRSMRQYILNFKKPSS